MEICSDIGIESHMQRTLLTQYFTVHHDLPGVDWEIGIVEAPIELLSGDGFVGWVVVGSNVFVLETFSGVYSLSRIEDQHLLEECEG